MRHEPAVPGPAGSVLVTCRISSVRGPVTAVVDWAVEDGTLKSVPLRDDGVAPDAVARDGVFSGTIPPQPDGSVVRFAVTATDADLEWASLPFPPASKPYPAFSGPFFLYQVDGTPAPENGSPVYRVVMLQRDRENLQNRHVQSDVLLPATFVAGDEVHYTVGIRYRGENSRNLPNRSFRIEFPSEDLFEGVENLNLNAANGGGLGTSSARAILAYRLFRKTGLPYAQSVPVNLRFPGEVGRAFDSRYERRENFDSDFLARYFGGSDGGNLYRGRNPVPGGANANLAYLGEDPDPYRPLYVKRTNKEEDDYSDLIELTRAFDRALTPDGIFAEELERLIDVDEWAHFFAIQAVLSNADGGIWNTNGEDYFLYRVPEPPESQRPDAGKFLILPWDLEESFADAQERLFRPTLPTVRRFLTHPRFAALYHWHLQRLAKGAFSRPSMRASDDFAYRMWAADDAASFLASIDQIVRDRIGYIADNVPTRLTAGAVGSDSGGTSAIRVGDVWKFFRGLRAPSDPPGAWTSRAFDDSMWEEGPTGIGYGDGDDATVLSDMHNRYTTVFARKSFDVADPEVVQSLILSVDYDDAFVAYVNGAEIARSASAPGSPGGTIAFGDLADGSREAGTPETFQVSPDPGLLVRTGNVLAIVGLNRTADSTDFSLIPALNVVYGSSPFSFTAGCEGTVYATGPEVEIGGEFDPALARSVTVNGVLATLSFVTSGTGPYPARWQATVPIGPGESRLLVQVFQLPEGEGPPLASREVTVRRASGPLAAVAGTLSGDAQWSPEGGPYYVTRDVVVPAGRRLVILPGTTVFAAGGTAIRVEGLLEAAGSEGAPIRFDAFRCGEPWRGIRLVQTGTGAGAPAHVLRHCLFAAGADGGSGNGLLAVESARALVEDCAFAGAASAGLTASDARIEVRRSSFEGLRGGVRTTASAVVISGCAFEAPVGNRRSIDLSGDGAERCLVEDTRIAGGLLDGMRFRDTSVDVERVWIEGAVDAGLRFAGPGSLGQSFLSDSVIFRCGAGAIVEGGAVLEGDHDTVVACGVGLQFAAAAGGGEGGHGRLHSLILAQNVLDVLVDAASSLVLERSDLAGGALWPGDGNIALPPLFAAPTRGDFSLRTGSPCIGTGKDGSDMGAVPYAGEPAFIRADSNFDGSVDLSDAVTTLRYLFGGSDPPSCLDALDADDNGTVEITDPIFTLSFLFLSGPPIPPPYPDAGPDPTPDALGCRT
ncbi:MAG: CotH kinase family protein [Planctomycetota bacterium]